MNSPHTNKINKRCHWEYCHFHWEYSHTFWLTHTSQNVVTCIKKKVRSFWNVDRKASYLNQKVPINFVQFCHLVFSHLKCAVHLLTFSCLKDMFVLFFSRCFNSLHSAIAYMMYLCLPLNLFVCNWKLWRGLCVMELGKVGHSRGNLCQRLLLAIKIQESELVEPH